MGDSQPRLRVAAVQAAPVFLDREATVAKVAGLISLAAANGAQLVVFPESFVPCYPVWLWSGRADVEVHAFSRLYANAVCVPGPDVSRLAEAVRNAGVMLAIGVTERESTYSRATLYNTLLVLDASGEMVLHHRKLMPTYICSSARAAASSLISSARSGVLCACREPALPSVSRTDRVPCRRHNSSDQRFTTGRAISGLPAL